ncbi:regulatory protein [Actinoplanes sp. SE50]|uniref:MerR family transcriptional regulator n=1 Tax=unclassified Actinoplanes TaxID=2626549 RepID=UPI00023ECD12|nr:MULTISPECIES: MerR family transcriptional regulator [unclassified Actinoplanes]AEV85485.1 Serine/threonine protein phosphatase [Actinoplanes sp. SE50/110]ATO83878.1 regulatory protein [Actinoplanes sp. SE50]SLM01288.1 Serine/threonine protein phosphatase [Actinoplanes sp. SE50/110]
MELLTIGAFARAARLTPKALRLYDEVGLLPPRAVDPESGYRFYHPDQLDRARLIARLRRIGMPLAGIRTVSDLEPGAAADAVTAYWRQVTADTAARAHHVARLVQHLSQEGVTMPNTHSTPAIRYAVRCDQGHVRDTNEDVAHADDRLLAVADGTRGSGAAASAAAVDALKSLDPAGRPAAELLALLAATVDGVDRAIRATGTADDRPATTLTALLFAGPRLALVHIGDTRAYLLRGGELTQLTQDHTWVQSQVAAGRLSPAQAATHPQRALLTRALGGGPQPVEADLALRTVQAGDRYLLCSDGLSAVIGHDDLHTTLTETATPEPAVDRLIDLAHAAGAPDNIACLIADVITT